MTDPELEAAIRSLVQDLAKSVTSVSVSEVAALMALMHRPVHTSTPVRDLQVQYRIQKIARSVLDDVGMASHGGFRPRQRVEPGSRGRRSP